MSSKRTRSLAVAPARPVQADAQKSGASITAALPQDDVKEAIVKAALEMFGTAGFDGTSISSVAKVCSVSTALIHYYFSSKAELWNEAVAYGMADIIRELSISPEDMVDLDATTRLKFFIRRYINYFASKPFVFSIIVKESDSESPRFELLQKHHLKAFYTLWTDTIKTLREAGLLRVAAPDYHVALIAVGACHHFLSSRRRALPVYGVNPSDPELVRRHADLVVDIIVAGITQAT